MAYVFSRQTVLIGDLDISALVREVQICGEVGTVMVTKLVLYGRPQIMGDVIQLDGDGVTRDDTDTPDRAVIVRNEPEFS